MNRTNQILTVFLIVQLVLVAFVFWPRPAATLAGGGPLLPEFEAGAVTGLTISDGAGNRTELVKKGDEWVLPTMDDFPVKSEQVSTFLERLGKIQRDRLITRTEASHKRLKVAEDDFERLVEVKLGEKEPLKLYIGSAGGASATHVRSADSPEVFLTGELTSWNANPELSSWIDTLYVSIPQTDTVGLTLVNENGSFEFVREEERWTMKGLQEGESLNESEVSALVSRISSLHMNEPIGKSEEEAFGLRTPGAVVTVETREGKQHTLTIGAAREEGQGYVAKWSASPYYVEIPTATGDGFINLKRESLLQLPATPTPGAAPGP